MESTCQQIGLIELLETSLVVSPHIFFLFYLFYFLLYLYYEIISHSNYIFIFYFVITVSVLSPYRVDIHYIVILFFIYCHIMTYIFSTGSYLLFIFLLIYFIHIMQIPLYITMLLYIFTLYGLQQLTSYTHLIFSYPLVQSQFACNLNLE